MAYLLRLVHQLEHISEAVHHAGRHDLDLLVPTAGHVDFDNQRVAWDERRLGDKVATRRGAAVGGVAEQEKHAQEKENYIYFSLFFLRAKKLNNFGLNLKLRL